MSYRVLCHASGCRTQIPSHVSDEDLPKCDDCGAVLCLSCVNKGVVLCGRCEMNLLQEKFEMLMHMVPDLEDDLVMGDEIGADVSPEVVSEATEEPPEAPEMFPSDISPNSYVSVAGEVDLDRLVGDAKALLEMLAGVFHRTLEVKHGKEHAKARIKHVLDHLHAIDEECFQDGSDDGRGLFVTSLIVKLLQMISESDEPQLFV